MTKYRKASEKTIKSGKGKSTDELSFEEAKAYFNQRAKETGAKRFRHNGTVYDLSGNKVSETPSRSSGGSSRSQTTKQDTNRPKANPFRKPGGARPTVGEAGSMPAGNKKPATKTQAGNKPNPAVVAGMAAAGVATGVAAARSNRSGRPSGTSVSDKVRAAGSKVRSAAMGVPAKPKPAAAKPTTPKPSPKPAAGGRVRGGGGRVGGTMGGVGGGGRSDMDKAKDPLNLN